MSYEQKLKQLAADLRALEQQARRKERDAKIEAETYYEAASKAEQAIYEIERLKKAAAPAAT